MTIFNKEITTWGPLMYYYKSSGAYRRGSCLLKHSLFRKFLQSTLPYGPFFMPIVLSKDLTLQVLPPCSTCWIMEHLPRSWPLLRHGTRGLPPVGPHISFWMIYRSHQTLSPAVLFCLPSAHSAHLSLCHDRRTCILSSPLWPISSVNFLSAVVVIHWHITYKNTAVFLAYVVCWSISEWSVLKTEIVLWISSHNCLYHSRYGHFRVCLACTAFFL